MFANISWTAYITFVAILLAAWYVIIGLRFYLSDVQILFSGKRKSNSQKSDQFRSFQSNDTTSSGPATFETIRKEPDQLFDEVEVLSAKIKDVVADASAKNYNKEEFSFLLQLTLKEHPELKGSTLQVPINNLIISECEKIGFIRLSAVELEMLWVEV